MDTPVTVYRDETGNASKMDNRRRTKKRKMSEFFSKNLEIPLEKENKAMYNSPVVCLGMKW